MTIDYYKLAPTWLFNKSGGKKLFETQEAVDRAWDEGWYGPPWLVTKKKLLSADTFHTKADLVSAIGKDPRYAGLKVTVKQSVADILASVREFEDAHDIEEYVE